MLPHWSSHHTLGRLARPSQDKGQGALVEQLPKNVGTAIGLELRDNTQALNATNEKIVKAGMAFNVSLGAHTHADGCAWQLAAAWPAHNAAHVFAAAGITGLEREDAKDEAGRAYALLIADTVVVKPGGAAPEVVTTSASKDWNEVAYFFDAVRRRVVSTATVYPACLVSWTCLLSARRAHASWRLAGGGGGRRRRGPGRAERACRHGHRRCTQVQPH